MKTTLVLLPGLNGTAGLFEPLIGHLKGDFNVLAVSYPSEKLLSYQELVALVLAELENIDGKFILLGESFSGPVALFVSERKPEGLIGVILVATFVSAPNFRIGRFLPWSIGFSLAKPLYGVRLAFSKSEHHSLIAAISTEMQKVSPRVLALRIKEIFAVDATRQLENCNVPLIYFRGTKDFVIPKKNLRKILSIRPDVKVIEFDTQHFLIQSSPERVSVEIKRFESECV